MTISTSECELTITLTEEAHEQLCEFLWDGRSCSNQALWTFHPEKWCSCVDATFVACCQRCRDTWDAATQRAICVYCGTVVTSWKWFPIGAR